MPEKVSRSDANGNVIYYNQSWLDYTGMNYEELKDWGWGKVMHPEDIEELTRLWTHSVTTGDDFEMEFRILNKEGQYRWHLCRSAAIKDEGGNIKNWVGVTIDIEQQKRFTRELELQVKNRTAELVKLNETLIEKNEALEISETFSRSVTNVSPNVVYIHDIEKNEPVFLNRSGLAVIGLQAEKAIGNKKLQGLIIHPEDIPGVVAIVERIKQSKKDEVFEHEYRIKNAKGDWVPFLSRDTVFKRNENNVVTQIIGIAVDITEIKTAEKELLQKNSELEIMNQLLIEKNESLLISENFNRSLTEYSPNVIYVYDVQKNKNVYLNRTGLKVIGNELQEIIEIDDIQNMIVHEEDRPKVKEVMEKIKKAKPGEIFDHEYRVKNTEGEWVPFLARDTVYKLNENNEVSQVLGIGIDITELKIAEKELLQKNSDLEKMNKELQSFAYISSHDLQEPLRKIQTFSTQIKEKEENNLSENGRDMFSRMQNAANRMQTLIQDLLAYSRTDTEERKFENTDLNKIVEDVRDDLKEELKDKNATIEATELGEAHIIPFQFRQLLHNLIGNSLKFSNPNNPPHIQIKSEFAKGIKFKNEKLSPENKYCHITVSDNGIGFEQQYNEKIFEVFQRLHGKNEYNGTGIGLSIVKKIVENHNGIITANGELNKGATFDIYIPAT